MAPRRVSLRERFYTLARRFGAKMNFFQGQKLLSGCEYLRDLAGGNRALGCAPAHLHPQVP